MGMKINQNVPRLILRTLLHLIVLLILMAAPANCLNLPVESKDWTVLIYINGNTDGILQHFNQERLESLEEEGTNDRINFVVQVSRADDHGAAKRLYLAKEGFIEVENLAPVDMGSAQNLKNFLKWGVSRFPADHYLVVLKGHGLGYMGLMKDTVFKSQIPLLQFSTAMNEVIGEMGRKIDVVGLDCCYMATAEAAFALKDSASLMVASQEISFASNWDYAKIAAIMKKHVVWEGLSPLGVARAISDSTDNEFLTTVSIIDCEKMVQFGEKLKALSDELLEKDVPADAVRSCIKEAQHFSQSRYWPDHPDDDFIKMTQMRDLVSMLNRLIQDQRISDIDLKESAQALKDFTLSEVVIFERHVDVPELSDAHGLSIYAPSEGAGKTKENYEVNLDLGSETGWGRVILKYLR